MTDTPWRSPRHQGINALFCYLRVNEVACLYPDLVQEQERLVGNGPFSADTLVSIASKYGVNFKVAHLSMAEFELSERPLIVYMMTDTPDDGAFVLVTNSTDEDVFYIDGATASIHSMSVEEFRRVWSGIALLKTSATPNNWLLFSLGLCLPSTIIFSIRRLKRKKMR